MPDRECLQCGETPASIKRQGIVLCGIVSGYYEPELSEEWPRHRWADWRDSELRRFGVKPEAFDRHRRTPALHFQWIACDDTVIGHRPAREDDMEFMGVTKGQCVLCGKEPETAELACGCVHSHYDGVCHESEGRES